jgi:hypothetical protein
VKGILRVVKEESCGCENPHVSDALECVKAAEGPKDLDFYRIVVAILNKISAITEVVNECGSVPLRKLMLDKYELLERILRCVQKLPKVGDRNVKGVGAKKRRDFKRWLLNFCKGIPPFTGDLP